MDKLTFQQLNYLCDVNIEEKFVKDCIQILKHDDCLFHSGIVMLRNKIASLYELRFRIAKEGNNSSEAYLADFDQCVPNLNEFKSNVIGITTITGNKDSFLIFYEPETKKILGILKSENPSGIKATEENATDIVNRGYSSGKEKYSKGVFVRNWK